MSRTILAALASTALVVAPVAAQKTAPTLKTSAPPLATALGEPVARTWATWWEQFHRALGKLVPTVGDAEEPELGRDLSTMPASIPSNFDTAALIEDWSAAGLPSSSGGDPVGSFRFLCKPSHVLRDDPVIFPGQPGKSHLHQFFGNTLANAHSTYASLRTSGESTCVNKLNRSSYWIPAMLDGRGGVVLFDYVSIYYKRRPEADPWCKVQGKACVALPRGLRYVFGYDMVSGKQPTGSGYFNCDGPTATYGHFRTITEAAVGCGPGNRLGLIISAPDCWNGKNLDSKNHRDHMAYTQIDGNDGIAKCPVTHPYIIPAFTLGAWYTVDENLDRSGKWVDGKTKTWSLSSDDMTGMGMGRLEPGTSLHADWFGAWDEAVEARWMAGCINDHRSCNSGSLGDGFAMKGVGGWSWTTEPRVVPIPPIA